MRLAKYRAIGADVLAVEVSDANLEDLAELTGAQQFTSPRTGDGYLVLENEGGSQRASVGDYIVQAGEGDDVTYRAIPADQFAGQYAKP